MKKKNTEAITHEKILQWLGWIVIFASCFLLVIYGLYFFNFAQGGLSNNQVEWGQFGDFAGGTINPILGFLTLIALILTIVLQSRQLAISSRELELSRDELALTRKELRRSASAQELSEKALRAQADAASRSARLNAINFLLAHYQTELKQYEDRAYPMNDPRLETMRRLEEKESALTKLLDAVFSELNSSGGSEKCRSLRLVMLSFLRVVGPQ